MTSHSRHAQPILHPDWVSSGKQELSSEQVPMGMYPSAAVAPERRRKELKDTKSRSTQVEVNSLNLRHLSKWGYERQS